MSEIYDIIIIGGGPVGLFGAFYSGMRGMKGKIIDSLGQLGGQLNALYPKKYIYDIPGYTKVIAEDLIGELIKQAKQFDPEICLNEKIISLEKESDEPLVFKLTSEKGNVHYSKSILIAAGAGAFMPRKLDLQNLDELEKAGLHYFVKDPEQFRDKEVVVIGGGDSAVDWCLTLEPIAKKVTLVHRAEKFQAHEDSVVKLDQSSVEQYVPFEVSEVHADDSVTGVSIINSKTKNEEKQLSCDTILCCIGFITNLGPIKDWGLELDKNAIQVDSTMATSVPGIWAAGDIVSYPGKLKLIATGFADAAVGVNMCKHFVDPEAKIYPGKSSAKKEGTFKV